MGPVVHIEGRSLDSIPVLLMAYGSPNSIQEIEPFYTNIRGGRKPSPETLADLVARYNRIGGRTPLLEITIAQARALQSRLGESYAVYVGMKHWHPYIASAIEELVRNGHRKMIALPLAPHYSRFSIDGYTDRVRRSLADLRANVETTFVESWNDHPLYLRALANQMEQARIEFGGEWDDISVLFTAHSMPIRSLEPNDPYPRELAETCGGVADLVGLERWQFAYQSAGRTGEQWLGPEILETLSELAARGGRRVLVAPIGFVADHLEILYDIDVECMEHAHKLGIELRRIQSLNASPQLIVALEAIVRSKTERLASQS